MHISINVFAEPGSQQQDYPIVTYNDYFQGKCVLPRHRKSQTNGCSAGSNQFQQVLLGNTLEYPQRAGAMWDLKKVRTLPPPMPNFELSCELLKDPDPKVLGSEANSLEDNVEDISPGTPSILKGLPFPPPVVHEDPPSVDSIDTLKDLYDEDWWKEILLDTPTETDMFFQSISPFNDVTQKHPGCEFPLV
ncbi:hypothetical protein EYC84_001323 [Monilinia fructicola]|uniref:Uncharacterized protein n=1 Tax=Monilinia fructicola TaxID=38448 RepID=A0A5M9JM47_MONFR|nr:hypothetical protein EYC84_001323 [Monilinia fructicola]